MKENKIRRMTITAILSSVIILMGYTPIGLIPLPTMKATILHIPVIIGAIIYGPRMGLKLGLVMGLTSMTKAMLMPSAPLDPLFMNPLVSVLPRALMGLLSGYVYLGLKKVTSKATTKLLVTGMVSSLLNTVLTLGTLALVYQRSLQTILANLNVPGTVTVFLLGIVATNGLAEMIITGLAVPPIILALRKTVKI